MSFPSCSVLGYLFSIWKQNRKKMIKIRNLCLFFPFMCCILNRIEFNNLEIYKLNQDI
jgi:hypothetical protein